MAVRSARATVRRREPGRRLEQSRHRAGDSSPADGYTLIQLNVANAINATLYDKLSFNVLRDLAPVASFMRVPNVMEVSPTLPVKTVPEFITYAKANPGKVMFASSGVGTTIYMSGELFKAMAGVDMLHVPYRGLAAGGYADLITGAVHVTFDNLPPSIELIRAGKLRALAVTSATRSQTMPELPTVADFLPGYEASAWYGIAAPAGTPAAIVERLNQELNAMYHVASVACGPPQCASVDATVASLLLDSMPARATPVLHAAPVPERRSPLRRWGDEFSKRIMLGLVVAAVVAAVFLLVRILHPRCGGGDLWLTASGLGRTAVRFSPESQ
jgi:Tripartite tricarboxylate transporter family receptor